MYARIPVLVLSCALAASAVETAVASPAQSGMPAGSGATRVLLSLINRDREAVGALPLHLLRKLSQVALSHSLDMADRHYFSHDAPNGQSPFNRLLSNGISYSVAGENLGFVSGTDSETDMLQTVEQLMLSSPHHRENLLCRCFKHIGIGIATVGTSLYVTEDFTN
jgi:uncharacterized protein YkwD